MPELSPKSFVSLPLASCRKTLSSEPPEARRSRPSRRRTAARLLTVPRSATHLCSTPSIRCGKSYLRRADQSLQVRHHTATFCYGMSDTRLADRRVAARTVRRRVQTDAETYCSAHLRRSVGAQVAPDVNCS